MHTALCNVPHEEMHMLDLQDKKWANEVKNLSYDIEDMVDGLLISIEGSEPITNLDGFRSLLQKMLNRVRNVADRSKEVKLTVSVANNRPVRSTDIDPRMLDWYKNHKELVGIDGPLNELVRRLTGRGDEASKQKLKIISIFGEGGLGKTTLAKKVFDKLAANFVLKAFVPVGRNPDIKRVLKDILFELGKKDNKDIHNAKREEIRHLIDDLQNLLRNKRYFIIIDDIWDIKSWEIIKCALIDNDNGSRVMTTSRIYDVAKSSDEVCKLKPLSAGESKQLFYSRLTRKGTCTFDQPDEQSTEYILQKCGGLPLAIITIASLLDGKRVEDWPKVYNSIKFGHEDNKAENTKKILLYSYFDLPCHLKTCLLYLSTYPEDHVVEKNTLVWKWIAEGFVQQEKGKTLFEIGEGYFNELINRSIIQPVVEPIRPAWSNEMSQTGTICGCRIHDMVLDLICSMAKEENFVNVLDTDEHHLSCQNNARILAVHKTVPQQHDMANTWKQQVMRSFNVSSRCNLSRMQLDSLFPIFRVLRVLSLEECKAVSGATYGAAYGNWGFKMSGACCLENLAELRLLRYLGLARTSIMELPMEIGDLRCLQILDLTETNIMALPQSVTLLRELKSLLCRTRTYAQLVKWPGGMGSLTSLEELHLRLETHTGNSSDLLYLADFVKELGKLTELRVLEIHTSGFSGSLNKALVESLSKLKRMKELSINGVLPFSIWNDYSPCQLLRHLSLCCPKMPEWIDVASLGNISYLNLDLISFTPSDLGHLGSLPELRSFVLTCYDRFQGVIVAADGDAFPKLRYFHTNCSLRYVQGAMQCLESLKLDLRAPPDVEFDFDSIQCLHSLEKVSAKIYLEDMSTRTMEAIQVKRAALRRAVEKHPNRPILVLR